MTDRGQERVDIAGRIDVAFANRVKRMDHVGIEPAANHQKEDAVVCSACIDANDLAIDQRAETFLRRGSQAEVSRQKILVPGGEDGQRNAGDGAVDQFGGGAVATNRHQSTKLPGGEEAICFGSDGVQAGVNGDFKLFFFEHADKAGDSALRRRGPRLWVDQN